MKLMFYNNYNNNTDINIKLLQYYYQPYSFDGICESLDDYKSQTKCLKNVKYKKYILKKM